LLQKSIDSFLRVHIWLFYFAVLLKRVQPNLVLMSNDHNVPNRALLGVCRVLGIKTAYVQHASVSGRFPALRFDYAFLDGSVARSTYEGCEANRCTDASLPDERHVFLAGVQKGLRASVRGERIGIAVKHKNDIAAVRHALQQVSGVHRSIVLRWHPGASPAQLCSAGIQVHRQQRLRG